MEATMEKIGLKHLDKSTWKPYRFEEIALRVSETIKPEEAEVSIYVGLEHIDSEDIHIRRKGVPADVKGGKLKCYPGDVIFGKRRAYQRKAAVVDFEGICSAHAFVFRANPEVIDPQLFPFFLHSDQFMHRMVDISVGGLSPTINWGDLKNQEFLLPPIDQQAQLAELLWAMDEVIEREREVFNKFEVSLFSLMKNRFNTIKKREELINLCIDPPKYGANSPAVEYDNKIRYIRITDIGDFGLLNNDKVSALKHEDKYLLKYGDFLLARSADPGRSYYYKESDGKCTHAGYLIKFSLDQSKMIPEFLYFFTQTKEFKIWIKQTTRTGTLSNINSKEFSKLRIPITTIDEQKRIVKDINELFHLYMDVETKLASSQALLKSLINQVF
jgi:type I restriction enzyme S subunit